MKKIIFLICLLSVASMGCSLSSKDKDRAKYVIEPCIGLKDEALRDCLIEQAFDLYDRISEKSGVTVSDSEVQALMME